MITIAYMTNRRSPCFRWFMDSLERQTGGNWDGIKLVVVDYYAEDEGREEEIRVRHGLRYVHTIPLGNPWQGKYRLTNRDYFAPANARNTAICHAEGEYIVFVDDLSVLMPGWLERVRVAESAGYVVGGAYKKVRGLQVEGGLMVAGDDQWATGIDSRWRIGGDQPVPISGGQLFGCSMGGPIEAFERINGFDADCDPVGGEDYVCGLMLQANGFQLFYDRRMLTYEWEEGHGPEKPMLRIDKGTSPNDKSHAMLNMVLKGRFRAPNYFGPGGIAEVRRRVLAGEPAPIISHPEHDWFDGQPLREM